MSSKVEIPAYVAQESVFDFDFYNDDRYGETLHQSLSFLHDEAPDIFYTPRNGGHWIATRHAVIADIVQDYENFSVREMQIPRVENPPFFIPLSMDPPTNIPYRQALMPLFSPKSIKKMEVKIRRWAKKIVAEATTTKSCEFMHDVSELFPVSIFMELMGMPIDRLREFRELADNFFRSQNSQEDLALHVGQIVGIMTEFIEEKRLSPDDGLISHLLTVEVDGRPLSLEELRNMCLLLFVGGLDTVTNITGFTYWHLATDADLQKRLVNEPDKISDFVEEGIRLFGVINNPRIVQHDCEKFGVKFKKDDMILCMLPLAGRDDRKNENPSKFDIDRKKREFLTFSRGPHLCVGHFLARAEMRILTEEWLKVVPKFHLKPGAQQYYRCSTGLALQDLPLEWE